uniref:PID domain-containing protein n=1 Tax=Syphacia muris TaxID=451379 RepID=A0A0N5AV62_9BILA
MHNNTKKSRLLGENICIVHYLGLLECIAPSKDKIGFAAGSSATLDGRSSEERLIELVENAQLNDLLFRSSENCKQVAIHVSKNGFKLSTGNVLDRVPLLCVIQSVAYENHDRRGNIIFLVQKLLNSRFQCHLFQTKSVSDAEHICTLLHQAFHSLDTAPPPCPLPFISIHPKHS